MATLTINAGSSSLKFGIFNGSEVCMRGLASGLGGEAVLNYAHLGAEKVTETLDGNDADAALGRVLAIAEASGFPIEAVGHRIVHGGPDYSRPVVLTEPILQELEELSPLAPLHQPSNLACIRSTQRTFPNARQVGCFDTGFHRTHSYVADTFGLPHELYEAGVRRYGFHGLSYEFISQSLKKTHPKLAAGRVVVMHLGSGASMCAIRDGQSVASTMGFSALDGLPMGTRCGQLDPGVVLWLIQERGLSGDEISHLLYHDSGLKGLSGISGDMRDLEGNDDPGARRAIDYFIHQISRELGALSAALHGLDGIVFTGGIGENSAMVRRRVCEEFKWFDVRLDAVANEAKAQDLTAPGSKVAVLRIETDEEQMIARHAADLL
ncbi:MAG: acetate/propionate family kinase [Pseudomonadota bacterium]